MKTILFCLGFLWSITPYSWDYVEGVLALHQKAILTHQQLYPTGATVDRQLYGPLFYLLTFWSPESFPFMAGRLLNTLGLLLIIHLYQKSGLKQHQWPLIFLAPSLWYFGLNNRVDLFSFALGLYGYTSNKPHWLLLSGWIKPNLFIPFFLAYFFNKNRQSNLALFKALLLHALAFFFFNALFDNAFFYHIIGGNINTFALPNLDFFIHSFPYFVLGLLSFALLYRQHKTPNSWLLLFFVHTFFSFFFSFKEGANLNYFLPSLLVLPFFLRRFSSTFLILFLLLHFSLSSILRFNTLVSKFHEEKSFSSLIAKVPEEESALHSETSWGILYKAPSVINDVHLLRQHPFSKKIICESHVLLRTREYKNPQTWPRNISKILTQCGSKLQGQNPHFLLFSPKEFQ